MALLADVLVPKIKRAYNGRVDTKSTHVKKVSVWASLQIIINIIISSIIVRDD